MATSESNDPSEEIAAEEPKPKEPGKEMAAKVSKEPREEIATEEPKPKEPGNLKRLQPKSPKSLAREEIAAEEPLGA